VKKTVLFWYSQGGNLVMFRSAILSRFIVLIIFFFTVIFPVNSEAFAGDEQPPLPPPPHLEAEPGVLRAETAKGEAQINNITTVSQASLGTGNNQVHGLIYYNGYLWATTRTDPARILQIDPGTLIVEETITVPDTASLDHGQDILEARGYIWVVLYNDPTRIVRVDPDTLAYQYYDLTGGSNCLYYGNPSRFVYGSSLEFVDPNLWVGGLNCLARVNINNPLSPSVEGFYDLSAIALPGGYTTIEALTYGDNYLWANFIQRPSLTSASIARIDPLDPANVYIYTTIANELFPDDMVHIAGSLYTSDEGGSQSDLYQFPLSLTPYSTGYATNSVSYGTFYNPLDFDSFWGAYVNSPGRLIRFDLDLNTLQPPTSLLLPTGYIDPSEIAFDENGNMYVTTWQTPSGIVRYAAPQPPVISIARSGDDAVLSWSHTDTLVDHYEIWRSTQPYFSPGDVGASRIGNVIPNDLIATTIYTDTTSGIGNVNTNHFYVARAVNDYGLVSPISNRVGEFDYMLYETAGTDFTWIALPLSNPNILDASDLATNIENNNNGNVVIQTISRWNAQAQGPDIYYRQFQFGDFNVQNQYPYRVEIDIVGGTYVVWTLVGNVPIIGSYVYTLYETMQTDYTWIMQPLDYSLIALASTLSLDIEANSSPSTIVQTTARWNAPAQGPDIYYHQFAFGDYPTRPGYPYQVEVDVVGATSAFWP
jgi:hypothetical protein